MGLCLISRSKFQSSTGWGNIHHAGFQILMKSEASPVFLEGATVRSVLKHIAIAPRYKSYHRWNG